MDTKSKAERFLNMMTGDESMFAQDGIEIAQAYLTQCQEVERLKERINHLSSLEVALEEESKTRNNALEEAAVYYDQFEEHAWLRAKTISEGLRNLKDKQ